MREVFVDSSGGILKLVEVIQVEVEEQGTHQQGFDWLGMVYMHCAPYQAILIRHLIWVRYPFDQEGSLPPWCQLVGALRRSGHHEDETSLAIWVSCYRSWRWGHLLVGEREALLHCLHI